MKENEKDVPWRGTLTLFLSYDRQIKGGKVILTQQEYAVSDGHHYNLKNLAVKNKDGL